MFSFTIKPCIVVVITIFPLTSLSQSKRFSDKRYQRFDEIT